MRKIIVGGIAAALGVSTALAAGSFAASSAGKPVESSVTLCGVGNKPTDTQDGQSHESKFGGASFMATEEDYGTPCTNDNSAAGGNSWTIVHGNVDQARDRGTEHGQYLLSGSSRQGGFNGHVTRYDFNEAPCEDNAGRQVYYTSGTENDPGCPPNFGPVGNFNTHGGAQDGTHFRGHYGTLIFQQNGDTPGGPCDEGSMNYCIQVDLFGQTN